MEDCDWFHEQVDFLMLQILVTQKQHDPDWFSENDPSITIRMWQEMAEGRMGLCTYRYQRSHNFLETGSILPDARKVE